jgi:drug/metabolite transporter (DMT)-like permease
VNCAMSPCGRGYLMVSASYVLLGFLGVIVTWMDAPESMVVVLRMGIAAVLLGILVVRPRFWREVRMTGILKWLLIMAVFDAGAMLALFVTIRLTSVAIGMFLFFLSPLWVALLAPVVLRQQTDRIVWPAMAIAMGGLVFILAPPVIGKTMKLSVMGIVVGVLSGMLFAGFTMVVKHLRDRGLRAMTIVFAESALDALLLMPLAVWQTWVVGSGLTLNDLIGGLVLGLVCTAFAYMLWTEGMALIPVQHVTILGYIQPMAASLYAFFLLGQVPSAWVIGGGVLILFSGVLIVWKGQSRRTIKITHTPVRRIRAKFPR